MSFKFFGLAGKSEKQEGMRMDKEDKGFLAMIIIAVVLLLLTLICSLAIKNHWIILNGMSLTMPVPFYLFFFTHIIHNTKYKIPNKHIQNPVS